MKSAIHTCLFLIALLFGFNNSSAQDISSDQAYKEETVKNLCQIINEWYVLPDLGKATEEHLQAQLKAGYFNQFNDDEEFAEALTKTAQEANKDKHMVIMEKSPFIEVDNSPERMVEERLYQTNKARLANAGFNTVKIMEGNVGYLDIRSFASPNIGKKVADAAMKILSNADAIIIDLSHNGGGSPPMVQYLCSYFFDEHLLLNKLYFRARDEMHEFWTLDEVGGEKIPDVPLFIITGNGTFSGAEEFSYNMQTQKRATLVGQTTRGGANPGQHMSINSNLDVFMPTGMAINPITNTNWEGTGVVPDVETRLEETLDETHSLALVAAEAYRAERKDLYTKMFNNLYSNFETYTPEKSETAILEGLTACRDAALLNEFDINALGYENLMQLNKPKIAECIFNANTILYPNSPNAFDSYGESLMVNGNLEASLTNYQKAVAIAKSNNDENIELYQRGLDNIKAKIKAKK